MRVFKFGGASVKDAEAVKNVVKVLKEVGHEDTLVVISAMGKTTNAWKRWWPPILTIRVKYLPVYKRFGNIMKPSFQSCSKIKIIQFMGR